MNRLEVARTKVLLRDPFYGSLILKLKLIPWNDPYVMATDARNLYYNEKMFNKYSDEDLVAIVIHEILHCVFLHPTRSANIPKKDWKLFGAACDYAVNAFIKHNSNYVLPNDGLYDYKYINLTAEKILDLLKQKSKEDQEHIIKQSEVTGIMLPAPDESATKANPTDANTSKVKTGTMQLSISDQWKQNLAEAILSTPNPGDIPGELTVLIEEMLHPKLPWNVLLENFISDLVDADYTWSHPNRRYVSSGLYLPSTCGEGIKRVIVASDTSGSVTTEELAEIQAEINSILENVMPEETYVIHCDTKVHKVAEYSHYDYPIKLEFTGRGGTSFQPVFEYAKEHDYQPDFLVYFTDMGGSFNFTPPPYPVLWINTYDSSNAPWGETFHLQQVKHDY